MNLLQTTPIVSPNTWSEIANGPNGTLFVLGILFLGLIVILAVVFLILKGKSVKSILKGKSKEEEREYTPRPLDQPIQMSSRSFKTLLDSLKDATDYHEGRREDLKNKLNRIMFREQEQCIKNVIQTLSMEYSGSIEDSLLENLDESTKILDIYLQVDINNIIKEEFRKIKEINGIINYTPEDISNNISRITENVIREMRIRVREYVVINKEIFIKLFDTHISELKINISNVIKTYVSASKETQKALEENMEAKVRDLEQKLKLFIEVI
jgi:hypothetical protein